MEILNKITEIRYSLKDALESVPKRDFAKAERDVKKILRIKSRQQLLLYKNGKSTPSLSRAKAVEEYFIKNWGITEVWKEVKSIN